MNFIDRQQVKSQIVQLQGTPEFERIFHLILPTLSEIEHQQLRETKHLTIPIDSYSHELIRAIQMELNKIQQKQAKKIITFQRISNYLKDKTVNIAYTQFARLLNIDSQNTYQMKKLYNMFKTSRRPPPTEFIKAYRAIKTNPLLREDLQYNTHHKHHIRRIQIDKYLGIGNTESETDGMECLLSAATSEDDPISPTNRNEVEKDDDDMTAIEFHRSQKRKCTLSPTIVYSQRKIDEKLDESCGPLTNDRIADSLEKQNLDDLRPKQLELLKNDEEILQHTIRTKRLRVNIMDNDENEDLIEEQHTEILQPIETQQVESEDERHTGETRRVVSPLNNLMIPFYIKDTIQTAFSCLQNSNPNCEMLMHLPLSNFEQYRLSIFNVFKIYQMNPRVKLDSFIIDIQNNQILLIILFCFIEPTLPNILHDVYRSDVEVELRKLFVLPNAWETIFQSVEHFIIYLGQQRFESLNKQLEQEVKTLEVLEGQCALRKRKIESMKLEIERLQATN